MATGDPSFVRLTSAMARMLLNLALMLALAYAALVALVYLFQTRLVYFPQVGREIAATPKAYGLAYEPVTLMTADREKLAAWWVPHQRAAGAVVIFHGNAGNISHRLDYLAMFHRLGYSSLLIDYRGYGQSTGSPSEEGTYRDAEAAWNWLTKERGLAARDIVVDDRRNDLVRVDPGVLRRLVLALGQVDRYDAMRQPALRQHQDGLAAVAGLPRITVDHGALSCCCRMPTISATVSMVKLRASEECTKELVSPPRFD